LVVLVGVLIAAGVRHFYALISFGFCLFVALTVIIEFYKGGKSIGAKNDMNLLRAMIELTHRNTRRYGGYLVHMGIVFMFIGFTGKAFDIDKTVEVTKGQIVRLGAYQLAIGDIESGKNENYSWDILNVGVTKGGTDLGTLRPERRLYFASRQPTSNVAIRRRLNEDLYLNFAGASNDGEGTVLQSYVFPLVSWIWIGYWGVLIGTIICLIPSKSRLVYPRTEVVTVTGKHAQVEK